MLNILECLWYGHSTDNYGRCACLFVSAQMPMFTYLKATLLHAATGFEVGPDTFASTFLELWELAAAGLNDGLDFLFGLL